MNYPFWQIPSVGGGVLIAIIAVLHVYIAHLAVGGGFFLVWTERLARRRNDEALFDYVRSHTWFFLLLTMVFGGLTGVGIWFVIALVHPAATSALIHAFVFGWAIEWVFFIVEITALLLYHYLFTRLPGRIHMAIGWVYFGAAWLSLFVINGILAFMLTPGRWLETGSFFDGFFNPSFWPSLAYRTFLSLTVAGLFGLITAAFTRNDRLKNTLYRYCARFTLLPFAGMLLSGWWYIRVLPGEAVENVLRLNPEAEFFLLAFVLGAALVFLGGLAMLADLSRPVRRVSVLLLVLIGLGWMGGMEYLREIARKPFIIYDYMYSTSVLVSEQERLNKEGFLPNVKWAAHEGVDEENSLDAGRELCVHQCWICHTVGGYNDLLSLTEGLDPFALSVRLNGQGKVRTYMPPFAGTAKEREALAGYIAVELNGVPPVKRKPVVVERENVDPLPFDPSRAEHVLLAWNDLGMHCISDNDRYFVILPPANTLYAQLIRRGPKPEIVAGGVELTYEPEEGYLHPESHVPFWEFARSNFGADLEPGAGVKGTRVSGTMEYHAPQKAFVAEAIPVVPYRDELPYNPYPVFTVEARDEETGELLAATRLVAPTTTEMGCLHCHGGDWRVGGVTGIGDLTAENVLVAHDRSHGTDLLLRAREGEPRLCQSCHPDPAVGSKGSPGMMSLSASLHGFHANYLRGYGVRACNICHPNHPDGATKCLRGVHAQRRVSCTTCHGDIEEHALSLLLRERELGRPQAERYIRNLRPLSVASTDEINPRTPWLNEPDCLNCHVDYVRRPDRSALQSFNKWTPAGEMLFRNRSDARGLLCAACHGAPHAVYPTSNFYGEDRDNLPPLQYQGNRNVIGYGNNCSLCHTRAMSCNAHHPGVLRRDEGGR